MEAGENAGNENFKVEFNSEVVSEPQKPRKFLKRGEGIKKRFGIDPAKLRIDNLPPYEHLKNNGKSKSMKVEPTLSSTPRNYIDQDARNISDKRQIPLGWAKDLVDDCMTTITPIKTLEDHLQHEYSEMNQTAQNSEEEEEEINSKPHLIVHFEEQTQHESCQEEETNAQSLHLEPELQALQNDMSEMESTNVYEYFNNALLSELQKRLGGMHITASQVQESCEAVEEVSNSESFDLSENAEEIRNHLALLKQNLEVFKKDHKKLLDLQREFALKSKRLDKEHKVVMKKLEDERMQFEIYMHDEKLKIEKEGRKTADQAKQKLQRQITELKKEIVELQNQLQQKEKTFSATEARLRAQARNWQKERLQLQEQNKELKSIILQIVQQNVSPKTNIYKKLTSQLTTSKSDQNLHKIIQENISIIMPNESGKVSKKDSSEEESRQEAQSLETPPRNSTHWQIKRAEESKMADFQRQVVNEDGSKNIYYTNGNRKEISADEMLVRMLYFNGDIKETNINAGSIKYYYATQNVWHTTYLDGLEIIEFPNGQVEHRHKDGLIEVHFPNDSVKIINPSSSNNSEEWQFPNGSKLQIRRNGDRILLLPNGQKEEHTKMCKKRVFPDGTIKLVYPDGSQETRYSNGRIRIKDKYGQLVMDSNQEFEST